MPLSPVGVLPPASLDHALSPIAELTGEQFGHFKSAISGPDGFDLSKARCRKLAPSVGLNWQTLAYSLGAVNYLYNRFKNLNESEVGEQLTTYVDNMKDEAISSDRRPVLLERLNQLVRQDDAIDESKKIAALRIGFLPNLRHVRSFVDVRPNFASKFSSIKGFVPIVQIRLVTDSDDPHMKQFIFQLDERRLQSLKKAVQDIESKLKTLGSSDQIQGLEIRSDDEEDDE